MKEKRKILLRFCLAQSISSGGCKKCPLNDARHNWKIRLTDESIGVTSNCLCIGDSPKEDLDKALAIIDPANNNPLWTRICKIAQAQRERGIEEYGQGLEKDNAEIDVRLHRIEEELIDALMYIEHLKDAIVKKEADNA